MFFDLVGTPCAATNFPDFYLEIPIDKRREMTPRTYSGLIHDIRGFPEHPPEGN